MFLIFCCFWKEHFLLFSNVVVNPIMNLWQSNVSIKLRHRIELQMKWCIYLCYGWKYCLFFEFFFKILNFFLFFFKETNQQFVIWSIVYWLKTEYSLFCLISLMSHSKPISSQWQWQTFLIICAPCCQLVNHWYTRISIDFACYSCIST